MLDLVRPLFFLRSFLTTKQVVPNFFVNGAGSPVLVVVACHVNGRMTGTFLDGHLINASFKHLCNAQIANFVALMVSYPTLITKSPQMVVNMLCGDRQFSLGLEDVVLVSVNLLEFQKNLNCFVRQMQFPNA